MQRCIGNNEVVKEKKLVEMSKGEECKKKEDNLVAPSLPFQIWILSDHTNLHFLPSQIQWLIFVESFTVVRLKGQKHIHDTEDVVLQIHICVQINICILTSLLLRGSSTNAPTSQVHEGGLV